MDIIRNRQMFGSQNTVYDMLANQINIQMHNAIPCIVQKYNMAQNTVDCKPAIRERIAKSNGEVAYVELPMLINVPVVFPSTANAHMIFPIAKNDECLVIFSDLSIDNFWLKGSVQNPVENRRHDLSDGVAIPCNLSLPKTIVGGNYLEVQYGDTKIQMDGTEITFNMPGKTFTGYEIYSTIHSG